MANGSALDPRLVGVLARLVRGNDLHATNREDTIGVLMRCGAFHEAPDDSDAFVVALAEAIDAKIKDLP